MSESVARRLVQLRARFCRLIGWRHFCWRTGATVLNYGAQLRILVWDGYAMTQDDTSPLGVGHSIMKGRGALERVKRTGTEGLEITAVRCRNAEEAEAMRQLYGDQPAQVLPLRDL